MASGVPCLQNVTTANAHTKDQEGDLSKLSKDGEHGKPRAPSDAQSNIFVLRKMVEEVFTVLYSKSFHQHVGGEADCLTVLGGRRITRY